MATRVREKAAARKEARAQRGPHAKLKWLRISPRKVRLVADAIRGKNLEEALNILRFSRKAAALPLDKLLRSALANGEHADDGLDVDGLFVEQICVDEGPTWRRWLPRAQGRATRIRKRTSHVSVELGQR